VEAIKLSMDIAGGTAAVPAAAWGVAPALADEVARAMGRL